MKNIEVSDEIYDKLIELATEMTSQDPRSTSMPHMFQIRDWKKVYDAELNGEVQIYLDRGNGIEVDGIDELIEYLDELEHEFVEEEIRQMWKNQEVDPFDEDLNEWIEENVPNLQIYSYSLIPEYKNCFLTAKAAQAHLDANYYHYHKKADVYLNYAWRNEEAELISTFICNLVGKDMYR